MEQSNNSGVYLRYAIGIGAIGALAYLLYKKGLIFKSVKQKRAKATLPKLLEKLGPTFKIVGTSAKYGDEAIADSINIGGTDYGLYFYPYVTWGNDDDKQEIINYYRIMTVKPGTTKGEKIAFAGTWSLKNNKLSMRFVNREQLSVLQVPSFTKLKAELKKAPKYSGTIEEILTKASGGQSVKFNALAKK